MKNYVTYLHDPNQSFLTMCYIAKILLYIALIDYVQFQKCIVLYRRGVCTYTFNDKNVIYEWNLQINFADYALQKVITELQISMNAQCRLVI